MRRLRRSVFRLLLLTAFLLLLAWLSLKATQYGGDWNRALRELLGDTSGIERFFNEQVMPRLKDVGAFFTEKVGPWIGKTFDALFGGFGG